MIITAPARWLLPLTWPYGLVVGLRNRAYDAGLLRVARAGVPVIAVGNLTAGGTGKTPLVMEIATRLQRLGCRVGVISRGYGRTSRGPVVVSDGEAVRVDAARGGDEPVMLAALLPQTVVVVAERRAVAARIAAGQYGADILVMDDGFQHRALHRDLDIVVLDGRSNIVAEPLLPAGLRREPLKGLVRAGFIAWSHVDSPEAMAVRARDTEPWIPFGTAQCAYTTEASGVFSLRDGIPVSYTGAMKVAAFSGVGNHGGFLDTLEDLGLQPAMERGFGDHHRLSMEEARSVAAAAREAGAEFLLTTAKDGVRLLADEHVLQILESAAPVTIVRIAVRVTAGAEALDAALEAVAGMRAQS